VRDGGNPNRRKQNPNPAEGKSKFKCLNSFAGSNLFKDYADPTAFFFSKPIPASNAAAEQASPVGRKVVAR
jgi:hypothetical protein